MSKDSLSPSLITNNLETRFIGQEIIYYPKLNSTMDAARREAHRGATEGMVVIAGEQTAGKGRTERVWFSPKGSIALSLILYPALAYLPFLIMLASLAVVRSIEAVTNLKAQVKWPNDVLINRKKVCGILIESEVCGSRAAYAIVGIGINANLRTADFPEILPAATSLADELKREVSRLDIIRRLFVEIERLYLTLPDGESIYQAWQDKLVTLGKPVRVMSGKTLLEGIAESVAEDGSLLLRHANGSSTKIVSGDVTLRDFE